MAHHLNNLLAVIQGRLQLTLRKREEPEIRRGLEIAHQAGSAAAEVIRQMLRSGPGQPVRQDVPVQLNELVREVVQLVGGAPPAGMPDSEVEVFLEPGELLEIHGDRLRLREALLNVLLNAREALPGGGRIVVRTWASGPWVYCSVADTGVGMSREVRARAPEYFFTTQGPQRLGLGLSVTHGIIQQHRGGARIESVEGRGTTVTFSLPVGQEQTEST